MMPMMLSTTTPLPHPGEELGVGRLPPAHLPVRDLGRRDLAEVLRLDQTLELEPVPGRRKLELRRRAQVRQEVLEHARLDQRRPLHRHALVVERGRAVARRHQPVVVDRHALVEDGLAELPGERRHAPLDHRTVDAVVQRQHDVGHGARGQYHRRGAARDADVLPPVREVLDGLVDDPRPARVHRGAAVVAAGLEHVVALDERARRGRTGRACAPACPRTPRTSLR